MLVYADNAASTPINAKALECMRSAYSRLYGNPSSSHQIGREANIAINNARNDIAKALGIDCDDIIFTSGGTESNNIVIQSYIKFCGDTKIAVSSIEHKSVLECAKHCSNSPDNVVFLPVNRDGVICTSDLNDHCTKQAISLVSVMAVNNELGTIQPISDIAALCREYGISLHTDAVQTATLSTFSDVISCADYVSLSGHKLHGPRGIGILIAKKNTGISSILYGGGQEYGIRPGTENVAAAIGIAYAICDSVKHIHESEIKLNILNQITIEGLMKIERTRINGLHANRVPNIVSVSFEDIDGVALVKLLSNNGVMVSTGSACNSNINKPNHVLSAIGLPERESMGTIRISYSRYNTEQEARYLIDKITDCVAYMRKITPCS